MLHLSKRPQLTVFCHFYNEEWLLPHWLKHHVKLFDHGIMVDYHSTDRSVEIIKEIAPTWTVVESRNLMFDAALCDMEIMDYEKSVSGWKMVLNVTEFVFANDLRAKVGEFINSNQTMVRSHGYQINDSKNESLFNDNLPIVLQRFNGFADPWRDRIIHCCEKGNYYLGRHFDTPGNKLNPLLVEQPPATIPFGDFYVLWYRFAPFEEQLPRKIQISSRIPETDKQRGIGWNHWDLDRNKLFERWQKELPKCFDIRELKEVKKEYEKVKKMYE